MLNGASAIAQFLGWTRRRLYYEADSCRVKATRLPVFRIGATLSARKSSLLRWIADQEAAALQEARS
ncbi:MAG: DNA-binding protein [Alphaproteobacteria bacterium]|nr:DNA-binding protein [Alphaproteobacteria bacterium]